MQPFWAGVLALAFLGFLLHVFYSGEDAQNARDKPQQGARGGESRAPPSGTSDRHRIKDERMKLLRNEARERYLRLHPDFVPPKQAAAGDGAKPHQS